MLLIFISILAGITAFVYTGPLTDGGKILNGWYNFLDGKIGPGSRNPKLWLWYPLIGCTQCVAGQFAFWAFLYHCWPIYGLDFISALMQHIACICLAIFVSILADKKAYQ